jgi:hypothetical protein
MTTLRCCPICNRYYGLDDEETCQQHPLREVSAEAALLNALERFVRRFDDLASNHVNGNW